MGRKQVFPIAFLLLLCFLRFSFNNVQTDSSASLEFPSTMPVVFVDPQNASTPVGETLTVAVKIFNLTDTYYGTNTEWLPGDEQLGPPGGNLFNYSLGNLYGFDIQFSWNPNVLKYVSHTLKVPVETYDDGVLHEPVLDIIDNVDEVAGTYWLMQSSLDPAPLFNNPDANSTFFTMTFEVLKKGVSALSLDSVDLSTKWYFGEKHSQTIPHVVRKGEFKTPLLSTSIVYLNVKPQVDGESFELPVISGEGCLVQVVVINCNLTLADTYNLTLHYDESQLTVWTNRVLNPGESEALNYTLEAAYLSVGSHNINATAVVQHADQKETDQLSASFIVINTPAITINGPKAVMPGQTASFDASQSTHPSGTILNYSWALYAPGESLPKFNYEGVSFTHTFAHGAKNGTWRIRLSVKDSFGITYSPSRPATVNYRKTVNLEVGTQLEIVILQPENGSFQGSDVPLTLLASAPTSWIGYSLDSQANITITGNTTMFGLSDGYHHVVVYAHDTEGYKLAPIAAHFTVDTLPPNITSVYQNPSEYDVQPDEEVHVFATIVDESSGVKLAFLNWTINNGTWFAAPMTHFEEDIWRGTIPQFPQGTNVTYSVTAKDQIDNVVTTEGSEYECEYTVIPEFPSIMMYSLFMIVTLIAALAHKRKIFT